MAAGNKEEKRIGTIACAKQIYQHEGYKAFFAGAWVNALRGIGAALILALYSEFQKHS